MASVSSENIEEIDPTKLIVNYLPSSVTSASLKDLFAPFGTVEEANVVLDRVTKLSRSYGFVKFSTEESAQHAIDALNGKVLEGQAPDAKPLHVAVSKPPKVEVNLYVGNLLPTAKQEDLMSVFARFGNIVECNIPMDRAANCTKGYGFVRLDSKAAANEATKNLNNMVVESISGSRPLTVKRADSNNNSHGGRNNRFGNGAMDRRRFHHQPTRMIAPPPSFPPPTSYEGVCVFVYNIPPDMNENGLEELFRTYGNVIGVRVMRHMNHTSKGYGFVNMSSIEEANNAISGLNGRPISDRPLQVSLKRQ